MHFLCTTAAKINLICASDECLMRPRRFVLQRKNILHYQQLSRKSLYTPLHGALAIIILNVRARWCWVPGLRVMHYLWRLFCVLLPHLDGGAARDTSRAAALMKILLTCFLFASRRLGTPAFVYSHKHPESKLECARYAYTAVDLICLLSDRFFILS